MPNGNDNNSQNQSQQTQIDFNKIGSIDPSTQNQNPSDQACEVDTKKPIGQYSESVRILIADMQSKDSDESKLSRARRLLGLSRKVESNRTRRELKLLALDLDPACISRIFRPTPIDSDESNNITNYKFEKTKYERCVELWPNTIVHITRIEPDSEYHGTFINKHYVKDVPTYDELIELVKKNSIPERNIFDWKVYENIHRLRAKGIIEIVDTKNNSTDTNIPSQSSQEPSQPWQAPTVPTGASGAVRKPVPVRQMPVKTMPMGHPTKASVSKAGQTKVKQIHDPATNVMLSKQEDIVISWVAKQYSDACFDILNKYCSMNFGHGFYPYPVNPIQEFQTDDGVLVRVLILTSATVTFNGKRHFIHYEIDGELIKTNHPSILKNEKGIPCEYYADSDRVPEGEKRCVRAIRYRDGAIIRYWLHEIGGKDINEGSAYYKVRDSNIIEITFGYYVKEMHRMGKKMNIGQ